MNETRERILARLRAQTVAGMQAPPQPQETELRTREQCIARFAERMQAVRGEVHRMRKNAWIDWLASELPPRGITTLLAGSGWIGDRLARKPLAGIELQRYDSDIESWKSRLFHGTDAGITACHGAIAETGSLVLWPDHREPRLLSLVPPVHIALLDADQLYPTLAETIREQEWAGRMPTNALLISGPSKTADIEQTLAYGIHGPKELITLILE